MSVETHPLFDTLNASQREAVLELEGPVLVVAGPGTGKTRTLTVRLAYLLRACEALPASLLAVTFTTRAAREMRERLEQAVGDTAHQVCLGTFHSFCLQLLRDKGDCLELPKDFGVCDRRDQVSTMQYVLRQLGCQDSRANAQRTLQDLSTLRNQGTHIQSQLAAQGLQEIYEAYQKRLRKQGLLDFDELLLLAVQLLENFPEVRQHFQDKFVYVAVDEYQDVNPLQYNLLRFLVGERANLWAVGDSDQAIYAFRGAQSENFPRFEKEFPDARVIRLEKSYRFTPQIAAAASQVIAHNTSRIAISLQTDNVEGLPIQVMSFPDEQAEAAWVVREIEEHVGGTSHYQHYRGKVHDTVSQRQRSFRDFAVLFRLHALGKPLQEAFAKSGIPFRVIGETRFFDRKVVKDLLAYLLLIQKLDDDISLSRVLNCPPRGIGSQTQTALEAEAEQRELSLYQTLKGSSNLSTSQVRSVTALMHMLEQMRQGMEEKTLSQFVAYVAEATGLKQWRVEQDPRHDNEFLLIRSLAVKHDEMSTPVALQKFLEETALSVESDDYDVSADAVTLMTLHAAKGLEFTEVILGGVEEGSLPYENADLEEERRLFYVGLTRAKERVHLLYCRNRFLFGKRREREASRFLSEIDESLKETIVVPDRKRRSKDSQEPQQLSLL